MSSSIPSPACRIARHLVPVPSSSRIGYRMISPRTPSHAIPDTTTYSFHLRSSSRPISSPHCFPSCFPPSVPPRLLTRFAPYHRLIRPARCLLALSNARRRHPSHPSHRLIAYAYRPRPIGRDEQRAGETAREIDNRRTGKRNATKSDTYPIPQIPIPARRIAPTSRITHGRSHEHANGKTPPPRASQRF